MVKAGHAPRRSSTPSLRHRVEHAAVRGAQATVGLLGERLTDALGRGLGRLAHRPFGLRREVVEAHLRQAFPDRDDAWIRRTAAASYEHLGREALRTVWLADATPEEVIARTAVAGLDALRAALAGGRGVVLVTGHLGNWELGGSALAARGVPLDGVAQWQANPLVNRSVTRARERLGMRVITRGRASRQGLRSLREGRVLAFVADQDARRSGVFVPFLGRRASTPRGPALLALRAHAPLFIGTCLRRADGGYGIEVRELRESRAGPRDEVVERLTAAFTRGLERAVRAAPEQYFWHHKRWKTRPPGEQRPG